MVIRPIGTMRRRNFKMIRVFDREKEWLDYLISKEPVR